jgi:hypothetical protein
MEPYYKGLDLRGYRTFHIPRTEPREIEPDMQQLIAEECDSIKKLLQTKNREYGNSALEPMNIFSNVARIKATRDVETSIKEDTVLDLIGYLVLLRIAERAQENG